MSQLLPLVWRRRGRREVTVKRGVCRFAQPCICWSSGSEPCEAGPAAQGAGGGQRCCGSQHRGQRRRQCRRISPGGGWNRSSPGAVWPLRLPAGLWLEREQPMAGAVGVGREGRGGRGAAALVGVPGWWAPHGCHRGPGVSLPRAQETRWICSSSSDGSLAGRGESVTESQNSRGWKGPLWVI